MKKRLSIIEYLFMLLLVASALPLISAQPPLQVSTPQEKIVVEVPINEYHKINSDYYFSAHTFNSSDGKAFSNLTVNCFFHLYNTISGVSLIEDKMFYCNGDPNSGIGDFCINVSGGNFTSLGQYPIEIICNLTSEFGGGHLAETFDITRTGTQITTGESLLYVVLIMSNFILFVVLIYFSVALPYGNKTNDKGEIIKVTKTKYFKMFLFWVMYYSFFWFIILMAGVANNYLYFEGLRGIINNAYLFFNYLGYGISIAIIWLTFFNIWRDIILNKKILRYGKALLNGPK